MTQLFISYRRQSWPFTHYLAAELRRRLDAEIFVDFSGIDQADFEKAILSHLRQSQAVLLIVSDPTFTKRIRHPDDWVRREIREALTRSIPLVLVCVDGLLPPPGLPEDIKDVARMQGIKIYSDYFTPGVEKLAQFVATITAARLKEPSLEAVSSAPPPDQTQPVEKPISGRVTLDEALRLMEEVGDFEKAKFLLEQLKETGFKSRMIDLDKFIRQADEEHRRAEFRRLAQLDYDEVVFLAGRKLTQVEARLAWKQWQTDYADLVEELDEKNFRETLKVPLSGTLVIKPPKEVPLSGTRAIKPHRQKFTLPLLEWVNIPAGQVTLEDNAGTYDVEPFAIARYPITNAQFQAFIDDGGYKNDVWWARLAHRMKESGKPQWNTANHPRETVNWYEAVAFCRWLAHKTGHSVTLPSEMEWQWAAVGDTGLVYPYGKTFDKNKCNTYDSGLKKTTPVDFYSQPLKSGASPFGVLDMSSNVWEWCLNAHDNPTYIDISGELTRALRGGSWHDGQDYARAALRRGNFSGSRSYFLGFRALASAPIN